MVCVLELRLVWGVVYERQSRVHQRPHLISRLQRVFRNPCVRLNVLEGVGGVLCVVLG